MLVLIAFIITIIGNLNWFCIGFFQYDFIAGLFGTQSSIFSRFVYIVFGCFSIFLTYAVIRYKGKLTIKKNVNQEKVLLNKQPIPDMVNNMQTTYENQNNSNNMNSQEKVSNPQTDNLNQQTDSNNTSNQ